MWESTIFTLAINASFPNLTSTWMSAVNPAEVMMGQSLGIKMMNSSWVSIPRRIKVSSFKLLSKAWFLPQKYALSF
jgi:hypothetical protein